jgi:hypothetical protein
MKTKKNDAPMLVYLCPLTAILFMLKTELFAQCNLDQDNGAPPGSYVGLPICAAGSAGGNFTSERMAQTFTVGTNGTLCEVSVYINKYGNLTENLNIEIQGVSAGVPDGIVHAWSTIDPSVVVNGMNAFDLAFNNLTVNAGETYSIVLWTTEPFHDFDPPYYMVRYRSNPYALGAGFVKWSTSPGWSGIQDSNDVIFQTKVVASPVLPSGPTLKAQLAAGALIFEWPTNFTSYSVQATTTPSISNSWANIPATPSVVGSNYSVTFSTTNAMQFFRLRNP